PKRRNPSSLAIDSISAFSSAPILYRRAKCGFRQARHPDGKVSICAFSQASLLTPPLPGLSRARASIIFENRRPPNPRACPMKKSRAELPIVERGLVESRERVRALILAGRVFSDEASVDKAGERLVSNAPFEIRGDLHPYV